MTNIVIMHHNSLRYFTSTTSNHAQAVPVIPILLTTRIPS